ncbi:unnamed protein product, partial [Durusdinium trenchii]
VSGQYRLHAEMLEEQLSSKRLRELELKGSEAIGTSFWRTKFTPAVTQIIEFLANSSNKAGAEPVPLRECHHTRPTAVAWIFVWHRRNPRPLSASSSPDSSSYPLAVWAGDLPAFGGFQ